MNLIRSLQRRFGISAPRMWVRAHIPWYWRWPLLLMLLGAGLSVAGVLYELGMSFAGFERGAAERDLARLSREVRQLREERNRLHAQLAGHEQQLNVERATRAALTKTMQAAQEENARLKEDLLFFRKMELSEPSAGEVSINSASIKRGGPGEYRYQLLVLRNGQRERDFQGRVELVVNLLNQGKRAILTVPNSQTSVEPLRLSFKYYQRIEGVFRVSPESVVSAVQVNIFENGVAQAKLRRTLTVS